MPLAKGIQRHLKITGIWIMTLNVELCTAANFENAFIEKLLFILTKNVQNLRLKDKNIVGFILLHTFLAPTKALSTVCSAQSGRLL